MFYLFLIIGIILGIFMLVYPEIVFKADYFFDIKDATPNEFYITRTRLFGTLLVVGCTLALFIIFIYNMDWYAIL